LAEFENEKNVATHAGNYIAIKACRPPPPTEIITLHPMPHVVDEMFLKQITKVWGDLKSFDYWRHKKLPNFRNSYLHLKFANLKSAQIPQRIVVNQHYVAIVKPGESLTSRCGFCKLKMDIECNIALRNKQGLQDPLQNTSVGYCMESATTTPVPS